MMNFQCIVFILLTTWGKLHADTVIQIGHLESGRYEQSVVLDPNSKIVLSWRVNGEMIDFEVSAETNGWVGVGFSPNGGMTGADIVVGWIDSQNKAHLSDRHGDSNAFPPKDVHDDYELTGAIKNGSRTVLTFRRKLNTCDKEDMEITDSNMKIIWALNDELPQNEDNFKLHTYRGAKSVYLLDAPKADSIPPDAKVLDFRVNNATAPINQTWIYYCQVFKLPAWSKHHIVKWEPIFQPGHQMIVHHMTLSPCSSDIAPYVGKLENCFVDAAATQVSQMYQKCIVGSLASSFERALAIWSVGNEGFTYPSDVGYPIMDENDSPYLLLQVHYENWKTEEGVQDNSGLRFYLTEQLRPHELSQLLLGTVGSPLEILIPPKMKNFTTYTYCTPDCTKHLPPDGITIFSIMEHAHLTGRRMHLRHFRDGKQLPDILSDDNYDFNYQTHRRLNKATVILPGDTIVAECEYNTMDLTKSTLGGMATHNEMCSFFVNYYPSAETVLSCLSYLSSGQYPDDESVVKYNDNGTVVMQNGKVLDLVDYLRDFDWQINDSKNPGLRGIEYQELQRDGTHTVECFTRSLNDAEIEAVLHQQNISDPESIRKAKSMHLTLENFVQHGYPKVSSWLKEEDKCAKSNENVENNIKTTPADMSAASHVNSFGLKVLLCWMNIAMLLYQYL